MTHIIIDRRKNTKGKSVVNRQRFITRAKRQIKEAVKKHIRDGNIGDLSSSDGKKVNIPVKDLNEPHFRHGKGGHVNTILAGNKKFTTGDRLKRPPQQGTGKGGNNTGSKDPATSTDLFEFHLTKEEFLELFFEDLELPDMFKKRINTIDHYEIRRAGYTVDGNPSQLNIIKSMKMAKGRRIALYGTKKKKLFDLNQERDVLITKLNALEDQENDQATQIVARINEIQIEIAKILERMSKIPFVDDIDLRYNKYERTPIPATQAVVFNIMDVSGSMGEWEKEMAKSFYLLMVLFLAVNYKRVNTVFIRYHTQANEVDENEFFHGRETGGTTVSPALDLTHTIVQERYPLDQWNIYGCHISDGDNFPHDTPGAISAMEHKILPKMQYFAYVEIRKSIPTDAAANRW
jgi:uncharacterized sporulation protein YeaH/YhbH (DUF444 family)